MQMKADHGAMISPRLAVAVPLEETLARWAGFQGTPLVGDLQTEWKPMLTLARACEVIAHAPCQQRSDTAVCDHWQRA